MKIEVISGGINATLDSGATIFLKWKDFWALCKHGNFISTKNEVKEYLSEWPEPDDPEYDDYGGEFPDEIIKKITQRVIDYRIDKENGDDIYEAATSILKKRPTEKENSI